MIILSLEIENERETERERERRRGGGGEGGGRDNEEGKEGEVKALVRKSEKEHSVCMSQYSG